MAALSILAMAEASCLLNGASAGRSSGQARAMGNFQPSGGAAQTLTGFRP